MILLMYEYVENKKYRANVCIMIGAMAVFKYTNEVWIIQFLTKWLLE